MDNTRKNSSILMSRFESSPQTRPLDHNHSQESPGYPRNLYNPNHSMLYTGDNSFNMLNQSQLSANYGEVLSDSANRKRSGSAYRLIPGQMGMNLGIGAYQDSQAISQFFCEEIV